MIEPARLSFTADGTPYSETYDDVYHTAAGGAGQAQHVFLEGNALPRRWQGRERFTILETGFGLGLNFLTTWASWRADPQRSQRLHFISVEKHPFKPEELAALHTAWPEFEPLAQRLQQDWPMLTPGFHRLHLDNGSVTLDLLLGDAAILLPQLHARIDAFYLDGFSPAKNPDLWQADLLSVVSQQAAPDATLATWSVAGKLRAALTEAGWHLEKKRGFANKSEMLCGQRLLHTPEGITGVMTPGAKLRQKTAIVLGAGLAGTSAANRLAARGWQVIVIDAADRPGQGASGNLAGVLRPLPSADDNRLARITRAAFLYTRRHLETLDDGASPLRWGNTGVLHLARDAIHEATQQRIVTEQQTPENYLQFADQNKASELAGWPVANGGWWFPGGAWVNPSSLCAANLHACSSQITTRFGCTVGRIEQDTSGIWRVVDDRGETIAEAPTLVLANAADARRLVGDWLPLRAARGQVTHLPAAPGSAPQTVVCRLGYVTPEIDGLRFAGATFSVRDEEPALRDADHQENLAKLDFILPEFTHQLTEQALDGRVGFRPISPDRLPIVGSISRFMETDEIDGLWIIDGFGARGIVWSALAGELLASQMNGDPLPLERELADALSPRRFLDKAKYRRPRTTTSE